MRNANERENFAQFSLEEKIKQDRKAYKDRLIKFLKDFRGPEKIKEYLDRKVCKQDEAKWYAAQLLYEKVNSLSNDYHQPKTNMLFYGPTGCGKTYILEVLNEISPIPIVIVDATKITKEGFKGNDIADVLCPLVKQYKDIEQGIIVIDEFDKLIMPIMSSDGENVSATIQSSFVCLNNIQC